MGHRVYGQVSGVRGWRSEVGGQRSEIRGQKSEIRGQNSHLPSASLGHYASLSFVVKDVAADGRRQTQTALFTARSTLDFARGR